MPPERLHELLASALVVGIVPCALLAWRYLQVLDRFFQELRDKEPALARQIGSPRRWHMLLPFWRFRKYTAFLPHLKQRVEPGTGGVRKVRWRRQGSGKRSGVRVIYYNTLDDGQVWLLIVYSKSKFDNLPTSLLTKKRDM
ncbi:hypothetical protein, partial [Halomonas sp. PBN3]|uniref:hypothetical protein n=1 Tax=Halomonas sp. PBN3 TaxID=1397528 RepID=UPI00068DEEFF